MADSKITALTAISTVDPTADPLVIVDVSDTSMAASGTTKKSTINQLLGSGGTATLASATITGNLTATGGGYSRFGGANYMEFGASNNLLASLQSTGASLRTVISSSANPTYSWTGDSDTGLFNDAANSIGFAIGGSEAMRLNSTGLGLGVSPVTALSFPIGTNKVVGQSATSSHAAGNVGSLKFGIADGGGDYSGIQIFNTHNGTYSSQDIRFFTGEGGVSVCTERMRITPSGNVGIGVTPANWATIKALQVGSGASLFGYTATEATLSGNTYYNAGFKYVANGQATQYQQQVGEHRWFNAPSGTAGNAITFTQAMTLDASGNLLVGRTAALGGKIGAQVEGGNGAAYLLRHNGATAGKYRIFAIDGSNNGLFYDQNNVGMYMADAGTAWIATSDETQKDIIEPISNAISKVGSLRAVIGKFKTDANSVRRSFLIAQDVQTALPEAVHQKDGLLGLSYTDVIPLLVAAIKELTAEVNALKNA